MGTAEASLVREPEWRRGSPSENTVEPQTPTIVKKTKGPLSNIDAAFQSRDSKFLVQNRALFNSSKFLVREKNWYEKLMTHGQISCTKILVRVSRTRNLDRLLSAYIMR